MMNSPAFELSVPGRIVFGAGSVGRVGELCRGMGLRPLLVTGRDFSRARAVETGFAAMGIGVVGFSIQGEPTLDDLQNGLNTARQARCDVVVACGGGAAIDCGKAIAALLTNEGDVLDYLEVIGGGRPLVHAPLPFIAIPTTAGTGAEATRNAVLSSRAHEVKVSLRDIRMLPRLALIDPELAVTLPPAITATTGMDALTQLLEAFVCLRAQPLTDALCADGITRAVRSLRRAVGQGDDLEARSDLAMAALFSGMALANAGLGAVHGFAAPIGGRFGIAHGAVCAALLPAVWEVNLTAVRKRGSAEQQGRFEQVAIWLTGKKRARAAAAVDWLRQLKSDLAIPNLSALGVPAEAWDGLVSAARASSSMKANPVSLTEGELHHCLKSASVG